MKRFSNPVPQYLLNNGDIASYGFISFFENGSTTTRKDTFADYDGLVKNPNPLPLSASGRMPSCFGDGTYTVVFYDSNMGQQWTRDNYVFSESEGQFNDYSPSITYNLNEIARFDGDYWISESINNKGNEPAEPSAYWSKIAFIVYFNENKPDGYDENFIVISDGYLYRSNTDGNTTAPPGADWENLTFNNSIAGDLDVTGTISCSSIENDSFENFPEVKTSFRTTQLGSVTAASYALDPDLSISALPVGWYQVDVLMRFTTSGLTTNGLKAEVLDTAGNSYGFGSSGVWEFFTGSTQQSSAVLNTLVGQGYPSNPADRHFLVFRGMINNTGGSGVTIGWSQATTQAANPTIVESGYVKTTRLKDL